ncbi:DUF3499 family protein [Kocuria nitroreducens]|uniref:DUF3499 family protein n=1 Tax=Kocuria nitroreducens TaxID=3058914 RepID=UPI0036DB9C0F
MSSIAGATRLCSRQTCTRDAVMTLTYVYSDSTAVVGPLAGHAEPHAYDLCAVHADRLTVPRGWRVVRLELPEARARREDIGAVAEAVRENEPSAPVRDRPRTVLRDVSLPRPSSPGPSLPRPLRPESLRASSGSGRRTGAESAAQSGPAAAPTPAPEDLRTPAAEVSRKPAAVSAPRPTPEPGPEVPWHDVAMPGSLRRAHLRRPAARGHSAQPGA